MPIIGATRVESNGTVLWTSVSGNLEYGQFDLVGNNPQAVANLCKQGGFYTLAHQGGRNKGMFMHADASTATFRDMGRA